MKFSAAAAVLELSPSGCSVQVTPDLERVFFADACGGGFELTFDEAAAVERYLFGLWAQAERAIIEDQARRIARAMVEKDLQKFLGDELAAAVDAELERRAELLEKEDAA